MLTAQVVFLTYGSNVIVKSGTTLPSGGSSIFMAIVMMVSSFVTYKLIDRKGRKFLLIMSLIGCAISHGIMATYMQINSQLTDESGLKSSIAFQLIPILCMASVIFMSSVGIIPITFICTAESFPNKLRPFGMTFSNMMLNSFGFVLYKMYPVLEDSIGLQACLIIFCMSSTIGTIYVAVFVEETKGKELNDELDETGETTSLRQSQRSSITEPFDIRRYSIASLT